jgi:hypothetical protein
VETFDDLLGSLENLRWDPVGHLDPGITALLTRVGSEPALVRDLVHSWDRLSLEERQLRCHETSTHYKWFLFYHSDLRFKVWLHQYKSGRDRQTGYAEVPHNHRYSLASVLLSGGFAHHVFDRVDGGLEELTDERRSYRTGDSYTVPWQQLHKLGALADHTVTLVVETPVVRHFSEAFYSGSAEPVRFYDFVELHSRLITEMQSI